MDSIISQCLKYVQSIKRFKMTVITVALIFSLIKHLVQNEEKSQSELVFSLNKKTVLFFAKNLLYHSICRKVSLR